MKSFSQYLIEDFLFEQLDVDKLKHLEHVEDHPIHAGEEGYHHAKDTLNHVHDMLTSKKPHEHVKLTTKYDGCLSGDTKVITQNGIMTLKEIYDQWSLNSNIKVLGFENDQINFTSILDKLATKSTKKWIAITLQNNEKILITDDHKIMLATGEWIEAGKLEVGNNLLSTHFL